MKKIIFILLFCSSVGYGQSVSIAPSSFPLWGQTPYVNMFSFEYDKIGVHFLQPMIPSFDKYGSYTNKTVGFSYKPLSYKESRLGLIYFRKKFPTNNTTHLNVWIELGYSIGKFKFSYVHISNAYTGKINSGVDFINITYKL